MSTAHVGWAVGGGLMAVAIAAATTWSAGAHAAPASVMHTAASPATPSTTGASPAAASSSAPSSSAPSSSAPSSSAPAEVQAQAQLQAAQADGELTALAQQLPADVRLTAPAAWRSWSGAGPLHAHAVDGCPRVADRLGAALGGRWRYAQGTLPSGPDGCSWTSAAGVVVGIGYERGSVPGAPTGEESCAGASSVAVPAVRAGALLVGCDDATGRTLTLAVPDTGGTGVFLLHAGGGPAVTGTQSSTALLAVLTAAGHAYAG